MREALLTAARDLCIEIGLDAASSQGIAERAGVNSVHLSCCMFPFDGTPRIARWIGLGVPLTHFIEMVRAIMLRGAGLTKLSANAHGTTVLFVAAIGIAVLRLTNRLDHCNVRTH